MKYLNSLISQREAAELKAKELTAEIKAARARIKSDKLLATEERSIENYHLLRDENKRLRGLIALQAKANGYTYQSIGEILGVNGSRAREIIGTEKAFLKLGDL